MMASQQRKTADALVEAFNAMDNEAIISFRAPDCMRQILPLSLKFPPQTNAAYRANLESMRSIFSSFRIVVNDVIEDLPNRKIVMYITAEGQTPIGEYLNEYVWKMTFDEEGMKVVQWSEFVDVGMARDFAPKLKQEAMRKKEMEREGQDG